MAHLKKAATLGLTLAMVVSVVPMTSLAAHYEEWVKKDGKWYYYDYGGHKVKYSTAADTATGKTYVLDGKGARVTKKGWYETKYFVSDYGQKIKYSRWYYLKSGGAVTTGWKKIGKKYYFFDDNGEMMHSAGYKKGSKLYLLGDDGARITKKGWYQVKQTDISYTGIKNTRKVWYYVTKDKTVQTGIKTIKGKKYYFDDNGAMQTINYYVTKKGQVYIFGKDGARITKKGWCTLSMKDSANTTGGTFTMTAKVKFYIKKDGTATTGWKQIGGKWYYFVQSGAMVCSDYEWIDGVKYIFNKDGVCINH